MSTDETSRRIGSVLGPTLIAVTVSEWINFGIWTENNPPLTYLNGMILFAVGVGIIRFHRRLRPYWTLSITIAGWLMAAGGLIRLFFPAAEQMEPGLASYGFIAFLAALGLVMTFKSYVR